MKRAFSLGAVTFTAVLIGACSAEVAPTPGANTDPTSSPVLRTAVHVHADGTQSITTTIVSREQADADAAARARFLEERAAGKTLVTADYVAPPDPSCGLSDMWLFDGDGSSGCAKQRNQICFTFDPNARNGGASGAVYWFSNYPRCELMVCVHGCTCLEWGTWEHSIGAFWPGESGGIIEGHMSVVPYDPIVNFNAWGACTTAQQQPNPLQNAEFLVLTPPS
jgi:hypothetical protein